MGGPLCTRLRRRSFSIWTRSPCLLLAGQPFDLTKVRLQTAAPGQYTGAMDVVKQTMARDGVRGCVAAHLPQCVGCTMRVFELTRARIPAASTAAWARPSQEVRASLSLSARRRETDTPFLRLLFACASRSHADVCRQLLGASRSLRVAAPPAVEALAQPRDGSDCLLRSG